MTAEVRRGEVVAPRPEWRGESTTAPLPDPLQAAIVLGSYTVLFIALAYWRLRSRDVTLS